MPHVIQPIGDGTGVEVTLSGQVTAQEILEASHAIYECVALHSQRFQLWDYTTVTELIATNDEIRAVARADLTYASRRRSPLLIASVQPTDLGFGLGRMYGVFAESPNWVTAHFRSRDRAERWIEDNL